LVFSVNVSFNEINTSINTTIKRSTKRFINIHGPTRKKRKITPKRNQNKTEIIDLTTDTIIDLTTDTPVIKQDNWSKLVQLLDQPKSVPDLIIPKKPPTQVLTDITDDNDDFVTPKLLTHRGIHPYMKYSRPKLIDMAYKSLKRATPKYKLKLLTTQELVFQILPPHLYQLNQESCFNIPKTFHQLSYIKAKCIFDGGSIPSYTYYNGACRCYFYDWDLFDSGLYVFHV
jgi:hypothetical protein